MNSNLQHKIEATNTSISSLLKEQKFFIDYFQREYRWQEKHIKLLVEDLTTTFLKSYDPSDKRAAIATYQNYYLGPVVFSINPDNGRKSIIDGQQRITSITLLLIHLNHLQDGHKHPVAIRELIFSEKYGEKSFNMTDELREPCLRALFEEGEYEVQDGDDETVKNMVERYEDIVSTFPDELTEDALPYFIDWFVQNVVIVEITAYSDENAYVIFETMNDRGLNLTPSEMLKGYVLSKLTDSKKRVEINDIWKQEIQKLHAYDEVADQTFFQAWFRGKYAISIRPGKAGSENQDFELIGSQFHSWFKDNHKQLFKLHTSDDFYKYFKEEFPFFVKWYLNIWDAHVDLDESVPHLHYINNWGIAESLQEPLLLASISSKDEEREIKLKLNYVARYIETFTVRRSVNHKKFGQTSIKYTMFNLVKKLRKHSSLAKLTVCLVADINDLNQKLDGIDSFGLNGQNRKFVKHLLSRVSGHIDQLMGKDSSYVSYFRPKGKQFEIEHIWGNKFSEHKDEFEQETDFNEWRNYIGALVLLPNGTNQSFSSDKYEEKLKHYIKENAFAQTLHPKFYEKNPNFLKSSQIKELGFTPHTSFSCDDIDERTQLIQRVCEQIWSTDNFTLEE